MAKKAYVWDGSAWIPIAQENLAFPDQSGNSGKYLTTNGTDVSWGTVDLTAYATTTSLSNHESDTTNVHGISDTSLLALTSGNLSQFASTTSSELANVISNETGTGSLVFGTSPTLSTPVILSPEERCNIVAAAATGTINFDVLTSTIWFYTSNATANHTLNFRGNAGTTLNSLLAVGDSISLIWLNTNGASAFRPTVFQIDGSSITPRWSGGTAPSAGNANSIDAYSFSIIKTAAAPTYTVLAGQVRFA